jgi:glucokinase
MIDRKIAACIDIGGTKALLGLVDRAGHVLARERFLVAPAYDPKDLAAELAGRMRVLASRQGIAWSEIRGLGYSTTGMMDVEQGLIFTSPNQGGWRDVPFGSILEDAFDLPTRIEMDANAAALGEAWLGEGRDSDPFVYLIIGTGIGAGILSRGQVLRGWRGTAGEIGHVIIDPNGPPCNCGGHGCLESLASGPAIALRARQTLLRGQEQRIGSWSDASEITAEKVFQAARGGDPVAQEVVEHTVFYLSIGITSLIHLLSPRKIALGGGVGLGGADLLLAPLQKAVARRVGAWIDPETVRITRSQLENEAGLLGAAWLVWNFIDKDI